MSEAAREQRAHATLRALAGGFSAPLVCVAALAGATLGFYQWHLERTARAAQPDPAPPVEPVEPTRPPEATPGPEATPQPRPAEPTFPATREGALDALRAGAFEAAERLARDLGDRALEDRARLFLILTRSIPVSELRDAPDLVELIGHDGVRHVGRVRRESPSELVFLRCDGEELRLHPSEVRAREPLAGERAERAKGEQLERARAALGEEASGLALHRLAYLGFACGARAVGARLLEEALLSAEGAILVDMFGDAERDRLQRARRALAGEPEPAPEPIAARPEPAPLPYDEPDPEPPPPDPEPEEEYGSEWRVERREVPAKDGPDPLLSEPAWLESDTAYRAGLELYRKTFGNPDGELLRAALRQFQRAQDALERLAPDYPEHYELEQRMQEVAKLMLDCMKRQRVE